LFKAWAFKVVQDGSRPGAFKMVQDGSRPGAFKRFNIVQCRRRSRGSILFKAWAFKVVQCCLRPGAYKMVQDGSRPGAFKRVQYCSMPKAFKRFNIVQGLGVQSCSMLFETGGVQDGSMLNNLELL